MLEKRMEDKRMEDKKIDVLGTEYTIVKNEELNDADGNCDHTIKVVRVCKTLYDRLEKPVPGHVVDTQSHIDAILRHELIHALANESGLQGCSPLRDEIVVDWIAIMYPKMKKIFKKLDIEN